MSKFFGAICLLCLSPLVTAQAQTTLEEWVQANGPESPSQVPPDVPQGVAGQLTTFPMRADFDLVFPVAGQSCENFEDTNISDGDIIGFPSPLDSSTDTALFPAGSIVPGLVLQDNPVNDTGGGSSSGLVAVGATAFSTPSDIVLANTFVDSLDLFFATGPLGVAMDVFSFTAGGTATVSFFDQSDILLGTVVVGASPVVSGFVGVSSPVPIGRVNIVSVGDGATNEAEGGDNICFTSAGAAQSRATFEVTKDFTDDNPGGVEVTLSCNTGLPLQQSKVITEAAGVEFVVTDFDDGELDCTVTEDLTAGYDPEYFDGTTTNTSGCDFVGVTFGSALRCEVTNTPAPVTVTVNKEWVIPNAGDDVDQEWEVALFCDGQFVGADGGDGDGSVDFDAMPVFGGSTCSVTEVDVAESFIEIDNGCDEIEIDIGQGAECTIVNTVFFEGIPALNRYGLALLALLMVGVGFVAYRRFA